MAVTFGKSPQGPILNEKEYGSGTNEKYGTEILQNRSSRVDDDNCVIINGGHALDLEYRMNIPHGHNVQVCIP